MPHLWIRDTDGLWCIAPLEQELYSIGIGRNGVVELVIGNKDNYTIIARHQTGQARAAWILMVAPERTVRINGAPMPAGIRVLQDRDHVQLHERSIAVSLFYSSELIPRPDVFPGTAQPCFCPRCKQAIEANTPAVRCPGCAVWYHQSDEYPCWTYSASCALCPQKTDLEAGFAFSPEDL